MPNNNDEAKKRAYKALDKATQPPFTQIVKQENRSYGAGVNKDILKIDGDGFIQSILVRWSHASENLHNIDIQLDLGKNGSFLVDFMEYFDSGFNFSHSAQDFWICLKDDVNHKYGIAMTPAQPVQFIGDAKINFSNKTDFPATIDLVKIKYYTGQEDLLRILVKIVQRQAESEGTQLDILDTKFNEVLGSVGQITSSLGEMVSLGKWFQAKEAVRKELFNERF